jgi:hypothetical protein
MKRPVVERERPDVGSAKRKQSEEAAQKSSSVLAQFAPDIQWIESYVTETRFLASIRRRMNPSRKRTPT